MSTPWVNVTCPDCGGAGTKPLFTSRYICDTCQGSGAVFGPCEGISPGEPGYEEARKRQMARWKEEHRTRLETPPCPPPQPSP